jgi:hypothetical protein
MGMRRHRRRWTHSGTEQTTYQIGPAPRTASLPAKGAFEAVEDEVEPVLEFVAVGVAGLEDVFDRELGEVPGTGRRRTAP